MISGKIKGMVRIKWGKINVNRKYQHWYNLCTHRSKEKNGRRLITRQSIIHPTSKVGGGGGGDDDDDDDNDNNEPLSSL